MRFLRRRPDRPDPTRLRLGSSLETLESRVVLSQTVHPFAVYLPSDLAVSNPIDHHPIYFNAQKTLDQNPSPFNPLYGNAGKVVSGKDRAGNEWTITVHGPGEVIVTDASPNDGELDDNINTITLVGTSLKDTYVTGETSASFKTLGDGTVLFNRLVADHGVKSIVLNGFTLTQTVTPANGAANNSNTAIILPGGVGLLQFHNIETVVDQSTADAAINIVIGDPSAPMTNKPIIRLDEIFNTSFDSTAATIPTTPQTAPTVNIVVNGTLHGLDIISSTKEPVLAGNQFNFPIVGTTGRTAVQAHAIDNIRVRGSAVNFTASQGAVPFQNGFSGLNHLGNARFFGNADAVGLDVSQGKIGTLKFGRGLGNPVGANTAATSYGTPFEQTGFPASGLVGGLVTAKKIGKVEAGPANHVTLTAANPDFVVLHGNGTPTALVVPGNALTSSAIVSAGSIGKVAIKGDTVNSEVKAGFHYPSFAAGLQGTRARSKVGPVRFNGNLVNGVVSATYRPANGRYGFPGHRAGPGLITGSFNARNATYVTGAITPLGNQGAGFYARHKSGGYLPPPSKPTRVDSVQVR